MFYLAIFIGIYSYLIFILGIFSVVTKFNVILVTTIWVLSLLYFARKRIIFYFNKIRQNGFTFKKALPIYVLVLLFVLQAFVNVIGALGPELAFDALWYHLTLPKLFLQHHTIYHIPGGLLYYSDMPKLGEMLYISALTFGNEILAKLIHFSFGILVSIVLFKLSRKFFNTFISFLVVVIFYSNLVVDWESITAYIDLIRTFFELLALWGFISWFEKRQWKWLVLSAVMMGLAITTKVLAIGSLFVFIALLIIAVFDSGIVMNIKTSRLRSKNNFIFLLICLFIYLLIALIVPLPWFIFAYIHTGNPVYPFFTHTYEISATSPNPIQFVGDLWNLFIKSSDPISPIYILSVPLLYVTFSKFSKEMKLIFYYCVLSLVLWYFTPRTGGGRFILPYLPAFSLIIGEIYSQILKKTRIEWRGVSRILVSAIILVSTISIGYRFFANIKYIPVIIGKESKVTFLTNHLNFHFGDFFDTDGYFAGHIKPTDTVLLYGFHNLYYVDFPFVDNTWVQKDDTFNYIAVQKSKLPARFKNWHLIYQNDKTLVQLYKPPKGECLKKCYY